MALMRSAGRLGVSHLWWAKWWWFGGGGCST